MNGSDSTNDLLLTEAALGALESFASLLLKSNIGLPQRRSMIQVAWATSKEGDALLGQDLGFSDASLTAHEIALSEVGAIGIAAACEAVLSTQTAKVKAVKSAVPSNVAAWEWLRWRVDACARAAKTAGLEEEKCESLRKIGATLLEPYRLEFERIEQRELVALQKQQAQQQRLKEQEEEKQRQKERIEELQRLKETADPEMREAMHLEMIELQAQVDPSRPMSQDEQEGFEASTSRMIRGETAVEPRGKMIASGENSDVSEAMAGKGGVSVEMDATEGMTDSRVLEKDAKDVKRREDSKGTVEMKSGKNVSELKEDEKDGQDGKDGKESKEVKAGKDESASKILKDEKDEKDSQKVQAGKDESASKKLKDEKDETDSQKVQAGKDESASKKLKDEKDEKDSQKVQAGKDESASKKLKDGKDQRDSAKKASEAKDSEKTSTSETRGHAGATKSHSTGVSETSASEVPKVLWVEPSGKTGAEAVWLGPLSAREVLKMAEEQTLGPDGLVFGVGPDLPAHGPPTDGKGAQPLWQCLPELGHQLRRASEVQLQEGLQKRFQKMPRQEDATDILPP